MDSTNVYGETTLWRRARTRLCERLGPTGQFVFVPCVPNAIGARGSPALWPAAA